MQATLKHSLDRFAEMLRGNHQAPKRDNMLPVIRDPDEFVSKFARLSGRLVGVRFFNTFGCILKNAHECA